MGTVRLVFCMYVYATLTALCSFKYFLNTNWMICSRCCKKTGFQGWFSSNFIVIFDRHPIIHSLKSFVTSTDSWCLLAACGGSLSGAGTIHSPYYPRVSPHPKTCEWIISQPASKVVILNFIDFDIRNTTTCDSDYVEVRNNTLIL